MNAPPPIKLSELVDAVEFVSISDLVEQHAYICRRTGRIFFVSDALDMEEDLPDDLDDPGQYEAVPRRRDLDLGRKVAFSFVDEELPGALPKVRELFSGKGAYGRFKTLLQANGVLEKWYAFEHAAVEAALRDWCVDVGIRLIDG